MAKFKFYKQLDQMDCGPSCLRMISKHYGKNISLQKLRNYSGISRLGVSLYGISEAAEKIGLRTMNAKINISQINQITLPCVVHWKQNHFVVLYKIKNNKYFIADPAKGLITYSEREFKQAWISTTNRLGEESGISLLIETSPEFYMDSNENIEKINFSYLSKYFYKYRKLIVQLFLGLAVGSLLQLVFPFLTQSIVDIGINTRNINFIYIVLIAEVMLLLGMLVVDFIRSWIILHISTRINLSILTDFLVKLMKLPSAFFDTKMTGDIMQRMSDQGRIQSFLTGSTLNVLFSFFNLIIFAIALSYFSSKVFLINLLGSIIYSLWVIIFLKKRRELDFKRFDLSAKNQNNIVQLISGIHEIKLNNCEQRKRWEWEGIQAGLFNFNVKSMKLNQIQSSGSFIINQLKNIIITLFVAKEVIDGQLTFGGMLAIQYMIGQLNSPIEQMVGFIKECQDAKISLERLNEIYEIPNEEPNESNFLNDLPLNKTLVLKKIKFSYPGAGNEPVIKDVTLTIPEGKITAIVGMSGSGKTTLLKLILRYYKPVEGKIYVGDVNLDTLGYKYWRSLCGIVMQDGFIFSDTIANNIAVSDDHVDVAKLRNAIKVANIEEFISELPLGVNTKIGMAGNGISQGQKQRILIARAVYKNPTYILFDEATNSLDANNEKIIMHNLEDFFKGRTVVVVAHRLSTVKNADNIIVLHKGEIVEQGSHEELAKQKGEYFNLVKNQLELSNT